MPEPIIILKSELPMESRNILIDQPGLQFGFFRHQNRTIKAWKWETTFSTYILTLHDQ